LALVQETCHYRRTGAARHSRRKRFRPPGRLMGETWKHAGLGGAAMRQATGLLLVVAMLLGGCVAYVGPGRAGISVGAPVAVPPTPNGGGWHRAYPAPGEPAGASANPPASTNPIDAAGRPAEHGELLVCGGAGHDALERVPEGGPADAHLV